MNDSQNECPPGHDVEAAPTVALGGQPPARVLVYHPCPWRLDVSTGMIVDASGDWVARFDPIDDLELAERIVAAVNQCAPVQEAEASYPFHLVKETESIGGA